MPAGVLANQQRCCCCCALVVQSLGFATALGLSRPGSSVSLSQACLARHSVQLHTSVQATCLDEAAGQVTCAVEELVLEKFQGTCIVDGCTCLTSKLSFVFAHTCAMLAPRAASDWCDAADAVPTDELSKDSADRCDAEEGSGPSIVPTYWSVFRLSMQSRGTCRGLVI